VAGKLGNPLAWSLIDSATPDPSKGVKLTYSGGEMGAFDFQPSYCF
jgi:hypothetical protein